MHYRKMIKVTYYWDYVKLCLIFSIVSVFLFCCIPEAGTNKLVPNEIEHVDLIQKYFPDYVLMNIEELENYARMWFSRHYQNLNPFLVKRDFDGNNFTDIALIMRNSKSQKGNTIFAIFLQSDKGQYELEFRLNMDIYRDDVFIIPIEAGEIVKQTLALDTPYKEVELKNPAVELYYFEKSSVVYYWDDKTKKFEEIWTSD